MKLKDTISVLALTGLTMAQSAAFVIPPDQPICRLFTIFQALGSLAAIGMASHAGTMLFNSHDLNERNNAKMILGGVLLGLVIIWGSPLLIDYLVGAKNVCGW